ncbi:MAG: MmcQ/YjbR family DNA-binding protein [Hymenobacteraceae bacterium]|nr:MmcQ/YjbR family DNA-binding protein [Hymenobacteraceae bacterium]MDX5395390.1 MmcQ/YjbR family DNA-binding protein [Hymenobacteraceae bacterium]MDX5443695.1 MmcQ/YjbR family DNA-binding protein [Hymenobacteraceae bacterium]MDX5511439.1 MmcQ/YjbR family DNA-binding protein [Hymenobacteraceae bacterium]
MNLENLRQFCLALPGTTEDVKWEDHLCFNIGGKMYAITMLDGTTTVSLKVTDEAFEELIARPHIIPAPYLARYKWVQLEDMQALTDQEWKNYVKQSYELVKSKLPKKLQKELAL